MVKDSSEKCYWKLEEKRPLLCNRREFADTVPAVAWKAEEAFGEPDDLAKIFGQSSDNAPFVRLPAHYKCKGRRAEKEAALFSSIIYRPPEGLRVSGFERKHSHSWPLHLLGNSQSKKGH